MFWAKKIAVHGPETEHGYGEPALGGFPGAILKAGKEAANLA